MKKSTFNFGLLIGLLLIFASSSNAIVGMVQNKSAETTEYVGQYLPSEDGVVFYVNKSGGAKVVALDGVCDNCDWDQAQSYCEAFQGGSGSQWHLPNKDELSLLINFVTDVNDTLNKMGAEKITATQEYWSSSNSSKGAFMCDFTSCYPKEKSSLLFARCVRDL